MNDKSYQWKWNLDVPYYFSINGGDCVSSEIVSQYCIVIYTKWECYVEFYKELCMSDINLLVFDVPTWWNSTHDKMIRTYEKQQVLNKITLLVLSNGKNYYMTDGEWELDQNFIVILTLFQEATQNLC